MNKFIKKKKKDTTILTKILKIYIFIKYKIIIIKS